MIDGSRWVGTMPQWSPALIGRESRVRAHVPDPQHRAAMEPCPYRQGEGPSDRRRLAGPGRAAMEPCPYRQGETNLGTGTVRMVLQPQWSPALIGRERPRCGPPTRGGSRAAMEPCPYRQGEMAEEEERRGLLALPQWSPALIGRESGQWTTQQPGASIGRNGALPLSAGRGPPAVISASTCRVCRNGALPLSAGRADSGRGPEYCDKMPQWSPALIGRESSWSGWRLPDGCQAAMEPCPYRQGERAAFSLGQLVAGGAAMEPCPYRQGETGLVGGLHSDG